MQSVRLAQRVAQSSAVFKALQSPNAFALRVRMSPQSITLSGNVPCSALVAVRPMVPLASFASTKKATKKSATKASRKQSEEEEKEESDDEEEEEENEHEEKTEHEVKEKKKPAKKKTQAQKEKEKQKSLKEKETKNKEKEKEKKLKEKEKKNKEKEKEKKNKEKEKEKAKDANKVPRAKTAFTLYVKDNFKKAQQEEEGAKAPQVLKTLAEQWKELPEAQKKPYEEKANKDKARADKARAELKAQKKPKSGYNLFVREKSEEIRKKGVSAAEAMKQVAEQWSQLSTSAKETYKNRVAADKQ